MPMNGRRLSAFLLFALALLPLCSCGSRWNAQETTLDDVLSIRLSSRWQVQGENVDRIDAEFEEGKVVLAIYPIEGTVDEAVDRLLDKGDYFLTGKSHHGDFSGDYFSLVKSCLFSASQQNVDETPDQDHVGQVSAGQVQRCVVYLFLFQCQNAAYCAELCASDDIRDVDEAQAEFDRLLEPGYVALDTLKMQ